MDAIQEYFRLLAGLEAEIEILTRLYGSQLQCGPGCSSCCTELTLLPIEAEAVRHAWAGLPAEERNTARSQAGTAGAGCPFLHRQRCLIYPARPVICRTHGLPVAYVDPEREAIEVSACHLNFPAEHGFGQEGLLFLDPYNEQLRLLSAQLPAPAAMAHTGRLSMRSLLNS